MKKQNLILPYQEIQKVKQLWVWLPCTLLALLFWYGFITQVLMGNTFGSKPMSDTWMTITFILIGILLPLFLVLQYLKIEVDSEGLSVQFFPFHLSKHRFYFHEIASFEETDVQPLRRFGGWGIRHSFKGEKGYIISGSQGIQLNFTAGTVLVISSSNPKQLIEALNQAKKQRPKK